jgi:hypothetical protein
MNMGRLLEKVDRYWKCLYKSAGVNELKKVLTLVSILTS